MASRMFPASGAQKLEDPERLVWLPPSEVLAALPLRPGMRVADVGAGTGYFTLPIARAVGPEGRVFAIDVQQEMLEKIAGKLEAHSAPGNVLLVRAAASSINLPDRSCDLVLMANVWHEIPDQTATLSEARRIIVDHGSLAILDWRPDTERPPGPPIEHRIAPEKVVHTLVARFWDVRTTINVGRYSYLVIASPAPA